MQALKIDGSRVRYASTRPIDDDARLAMKARALEHRRFGHTSTDR